MAEQLLRRAHRFYLAHLDVDDAENYLHAHSDILEVPERDRRPFDIDAAEALLLAAIVVYARPFVRSNTDGTADPKLPVEAMFFGAARERKLHDEVIALRHKAAAHSDAEYHRAFTWREVKSGGIRRKHWRPEFRGMVDVVRFWELITHVKYAITRELEDLDVDLFLDGSDLIPVNALLGIVRPVTLISGAG